MNLRLVVMSIPTLALTPLGAATDLVVEGEILAQGAVLRGANGLAFDAYDTLHVASLLGRSIVAMNHDTGAVLGVLDGAAGVESPDDLTFGPDGSLYWTSFLTGAVGRLTPGGVFSAQLVGLGVNPVTFADDGRLFVAQCFLGEQLVELDPDLVEPPTLITDAIGPGCGLNGMDWGPDGSLYGPRWFLGDVVRVDVDSGEVTPVAAGFAAPGAVKFDSLGRLHVVDAALGQVTRVDVDTGDVELLTTLTPGLDNLAFDAADRLFVSNFADGSIVEVYPSGTWSTVSGGGVIAPAGLAVLPRDGGESLFVADVLSIRALDAATGAELDRDVTFFVPGGLTQPLTVSADPDGLLLSSWFGNTVQVWDPGSHQIVVSFDDFAVPMNAIRFQGDFIVAELGTNSVVRASGADPSQRETLAGQLGVPAGLAATDQDLWVSDWATGAVLQVVADGGVLSPPVAVATGLSMPEGLAVHPDGSLIVVETGTGRLLRIAEGAVSVLAEGLCLGAPGIPGYPPSWVFNGVAVSETGVIYVSADVANAVYRFEPVEADGEDCPGDVDGDGHVGVEDLVQVLVAWGPCAFSPADVDGDGTVGVADLVIVILSWGGCP